MESPASWSSPALSFQHKLHYIYIYIYVCFSYPMCLYRRDSPHIGTDCPTSELRGMYEIWSDHGPWSGGCLCSSCEVVPSEQFVDSHPQSSPFPTTARKRWAQADSKLALTLHLISTLRISWPQRETPNRDIGIYRDICDVSFKYRGFNTI